jgi:hypothetical protein
MAAATGGTDAPIDRDAEPHRQPDDRASTDEE